MPKHVYDTLIVGTGFTGIGTAIKLAEAGRRRLRHRRTRRPRRRHLARQHVSRCGVRYPVAAVLVLVRQEPELVARLLARRRDLRAHRGHGRRVRPASAHPVRHRGQRPALRRDRGRLDRERRTAASASRPAPSCWPPGRCPITSCPTSAASTPTRATRSTAPRWDHDYDFTGKRVAVIGTGASAVQIVPGTGQAGRLRQGLPAHTGLGAAPAGRRHARRRAGAVRESACRPTACPPGAVLGPRGQRHRAGVGLPLTSLVARLGKAHLRRQVKDPWLRRQLTPDFTPGCKRMLISSDYYPALQTRQLQAHRLADRHHEPGRASAPATASSTTWTASCSPPATTCT